MKNLKIRTQLILGFTIIFLFVILLGFFLVIQTTKIAEQTTLLYNHPVQVSNAISNLQKDILMIHRDMKSMILTDDPGEVTALIALTETYESDAFNQIEILYNNYLGPVSDIDTIKNEFIYWNSIRYETIRLLLAGQVEEAAMRTQSYGVGGGQADVVITSLEAVNQYALNKTEDFYQNAQQISDQSKLQSIIIVSIIILSMLIIYYFLFDSVKKPLNNLIIASKQFQAGDLNARSQYQFNNEFGELSNSFNEMADSIEQNYQVINKREKFSGLLLIESELKPFFEMILQELIRQSGSQVGAVYLLSEDQKQYKLLNSIGMRDQPEKTFSAETKEGEFGLAGTTKEIIHLNEIGENNFYHFKTAYGEFVPNEIITIPLIAEDKVPVMISIATLGYYNPTVLKYIDEVWKLLNARLTGLLAMDEIKRLATELEQQNQELDSQNMELLSQTIELNQQNIELDLQKKQLGQANQMKTSFISNMSHELRTPLNSIIALSGVLSRHLENKISEDEFSYLEVIERNGKQLLDLINDILDISRIESGREEIEISHFNLDNLLNEIVSLVSPIADQKDLLISQNYSSELSKINSDYKKCRHILQNIITNAVKFTEQGEVIISVDEKKNQFIIKVRDTGIGIAEKDLSRIFEEFRQADES
ncbi:MAG TPA: histidine kinase dimerization/phospho-acceptor domain-containing protein, partial [Anaerolineaceae bacterium]|nr:histidine kinase dimerization/phospho-acceptor domain-containing protein [Anaerolineaceae bacterium]